MKNRFMLILAVLLLAAGAQATTYYVAEKPTSGNGLSWANAFNSIANVNSAVAAGDTVYFGTGEWRGLLVARQGTYSDRTCYACSSFADTNGNGEYHFAKIYGSTDMSGGWSSLGGNKYQKSWTASISMPQLYQEDTILWRQTSAGAVNSPGEWYYSGGVVTVYMNDLGLGFHPDSYELEMAEDAIVTMDRNGSTDGQDYVTFWGLEFKYSSDYGFMTTINSMENDPYDSVFIDHCKLSMVAGWYGGNPAIVYSGYSSGDPTGQFNRVRACSLGNCWGLSDVDYVPYSNKGSAICHYSQSNYTVDSNVFYGYFKEGAVYWKSAYGGPKNINNVIRYNLFTNNPGSGVEFFGAVSNAQIYGNVFIGIDKAFYDRYDDWSGMGGHRIYNNTFINCSDLLQWSTGDGVVPSTNSEFKYNVIYNSGSLYSRIDTYNAAGGAQFKQVNRNLYYVTGSTQLVVSGTTNNASQWQSRGLDLASTFTVNPGFANVSILDLRRPSATQEMDTTYGGTHWLLYGAVQAGATPPPPDIDPPIISAVAANSITALLATIVWTTNEPATSQVQYGLTTSYGQSTTLNPSLILAHSVPLSGLTAATTYHYRVLSTDLAGNTRTGTDFSFTTTAPPPPDTVAPVISGVAANSITQSSAAIVWTTNEPATSQVQYGLTTAYGQNTTLNPSLTTGHTVPLSGLATATTYHYRVLSSDQAGNTRTGTDFTFTTTAPPPPDTVAPVISAVGAAGLNSSSATINWTTNEPATSRVQYGLTTSYGQITPLNSSLVTSHSEQLAGLDSSTTYHYRVISADQAGNTRTGTDFTFTTLSASQSNLAIGAAVTVSGTYGSYLPSAVNDGVYTPRVLSTTWASDESSTAAHWVELDFGQTRAIGRVTMNWTWNSSQSRWMTSQQYTIQSWNGSAWTDVNYVVTSSIDSATTTVFSTVNTSRIRVYQPANMGPSTYAAIMWLAEVEVFGSVPSDVAPPSAINDLGWLPQDDDLEMMILGTVEFDAARPVEAVLPFRRESRSPVCGC